jgi:hypothetical protein
MTTRAHLQSPIAAQALCYGPIRWVLSRQLIDDESLQVDRQDNVSLFFQRLYALFQSIHYHNANQLARVPYKYSKTSLTCTGSDNTDPRFTRTNFLAWPEVLDSFSFWITRTTVNTDVFGRSPEVRVNEVLL